jgi:hypothetical protein
MHDCEMLWLGPPVNKTGWGNWDGCAPALCFDASEDSLMEEILIENILIHLYEDRHERDLIKIEPVLTRFAKLDKMGRLRNLTFRNIECTGPWQPRICIWGKDEEHDVKDVTFEQVTIAGETVTENYPQLSIGEYTEAITFA